MTPQISPGEAATTGLSDMETCAENASNGPSGAAVAGAGGAPIKTAWPTEVVLLGSGLFGNLAMSVLSPALPVIERHFADEPGAAYITKLLISAVGVAAISVSFFAGPLVGRFGRRRVLLGAYMLFVVAGTVGMWLPTLWTIIASRVLAGGAGALIVALGITLIGDIYEGRSRERRIGANHAIGALLLGLMVPFAGYLADFNWRWAFLTHLVALPVLACVYFSRDLRPLDARVGAHMKAQPRTATKLPRAVIALALLTTVAGGISYSVQIYVPFQLRLIGSHSAALAGTMFSVMVLCSITTSFVYAELRRWISTAGIFALVFLGWCVGLGTATFADQVWEIGVGMAVVGLGGGLLGPNLFSIVAAITSDTNRPQTVGLIKGIYYAGPFIGPTLLQIIYQQHGATGALLTLSIAAGTMCAVMLAFVISGRAPWQKTGAST